jgi:hypothetical protein
MANSYGIYDDQGKRITRVSSSTAQKLLARSHKLIGYKMLGPMTPAEKDAARQAANMASYYQPYIPAEMPALELSGIDSRSVPRITPTGHKLEL